MIVQGSAYYNENNPLAADWLEALIAQNLIAPGDVDRRSIVEVKADEICGYTQHHFFAGIGGWSYGLRLAKWPDERPVCTGSAPCQPFSAAGKQLGIKDPRHLWPFWRNIVSELRPPTIFGEQVASKAGREWFSGVRADLEALEYATGSADLCAASVGAPHKRQRLYWVAHAIGLQQWWEEPRGRKIGRVGRIVKPVSWDRKWESALREFRGVDDGLSYGVGITDGFRNAIVPSVAQAFIECAQ